MWLAEVPHDMILLLLKFEHIAFWVFLLIHVLGLCVSKVEIWGTFLHVQPQ